ncbi:hypothetical protein PFNF135_03329 [Plasmodium falciparum NF135/5.C10]|nr:hypothetical protein PFNF135_03329 [Plasmodium falciparum NF135/5.C10]
MIHIEKENYNVNNVKIINNDITNEISDTTMNIIKQDQINEKQNYDIITKTKENLMNNSDKGNIDILPNEKYNVDKHIHNINVDKDIKDGCHFYDMTNSNMNDTKFNILITPSFSTIQNKKDINDTCEKDYTSNKMNKIKNNDDNNDNNNDDNNDDNNDNNNDNNNDDDNNNIIICEDEINHELKYNIKGGDKEEYSNQLENYNSIAVQINDFNIDDVLKKKYTNESIHKMEKNSFEDNDIMIPKNNEILQNGNNEIWHNNNNIKKEDAYDDYLEDKDNKKDNFHFNEIPLLGGFLFKRNEESVDGNISNMNKNSCNEEDMNNNENIEYHIPFYKKKKEKSGRKLKSSGKEKHTYEINKGNKNIKNRWSLNKNTYYYHSHLLNEEMNILERSDAINVKRYREEHNKDRYKVCKKMFRCLFCKRYKKEERLDKIRKDISSDLEDPFVMNVKSPIQLTLSGNEYITKDMIEVFLKPEETEEFMKEFDLSGHGKIDIIMFRNAIKRAISCRKKFIKSLKGQESILKLVRRLMSILLSFLASVVLLFLFGVSADTIIVTGAAFITAVTVILSYMYTNFITSVIFIAFSNPYNIGDRIRLDGGEAMYIKKIKTYTTEFETTTGKIVIYENSKLSNVKIYNESRSKNAYIDISFKVDINTPLVALKELRKSLQCLVDSRPSDFCKTKNLYFGYSLQPGHFYEISFWIKCVEGWGNWRKVFELRTDIYDFIILQLRILSISYRLPTQKIGFTAPLNIADGYNNNNNNNNNNIQSNYNINRNINNNMNINTQQPKINYPPHGNNNFPTHHLRYNRNKPLQYTSPPKEARNPLFLETAKHKREFDISSIQSNNEQHEAPNHIIYNEPVNFEDQPLKKNKLRSVYNSYKYVESTNHNNMDTSIENGNGYMYESYLQKNEDNNDYFVYNKKKKKNNKKKKTHDFNTKKNININNNNNNNNKMNNNKNNLFMNTFQNNVQSISSMNNYHDVYYNNDKYYKTLHGQQNLYNNNNIKNINNHENIDNHNYNKINNILYNYTNTNLITSDNSYSYDNKKIIKCNYVPDVSNSDDSNHTDNMKGNNIYRNNNNFNNNSNNMKVKRGDHFNPIYPYNDDIYTAHKNKEPQNIFENLYKLKKISNTNLDEKNYFSYDSSSGYDSYDCVKHFTYLHDKKQNILLKRRKIKMA